MASNNIDFNRWLNNISPKKSGKGARQNDHLIISEEEQEQQEQEQQSNEFLLINEVKFNNLGLWEIKKKIEELTKDGQYKMDEIVIAVGRYSQLTGNNELKKHSKALFAAGKAIDNINRQVRRAGYRGTVIFRMNNKND